MVITLQLSFDIRIQGIFMVYRSLEKFLSDVDNKVKNSIKHLQDTQEVLPEGAGDIAEEIHKLGEQIGTKLAEAEKLGEEGNVQESLKLMTEVEDLNRQKSIVELNLRNMIPPHQYQQQKLRVCEICSAYLGIQDNDRRLADHFGGKLHLGFITLRKKLIEMEKLAYSSDNDKKSISESDKIRSSKNYDKEKKEKSPRETKKSSPKESKKSSKDDRDKNYKHRHSDSDSRRSKKSSHKRKRSRSRSKSKRSDRKRRSVSPHRSSYSDRRRERERDDRRRDRNSRKSRSRDRYSRKRSRSRRSDRHSRR